MTLLYPLPLRHVSDLPLDGKRVFLRLDLNVTQKDGVIRDSSRITASLPTLRHLLQRSCKVVVGAHLGEPKDRDPHCSLAAVGSALAEATGHEVILMDDYDKEPADQMLRQLRSNQFILLENLRYFPEETKADDTFAAQLMAGVDFFVNDAFEALHCSHASIVQAPLCVPADQRGAGFLVFEEIKALGQFLKASLQPFHVIFGGNKISSKVPALLELLKHCQHLYLGGSLGAAMLALKEGSKASIKDPKTQLLMEAILRSVAARRVTLHLPKDHRIISQEDQMQGSYTEGLVTEDAQIPQGFLAYDIGPKTLKAWSQSLQNASSIFWDGPVGVYEKEAFRQGSFGLLEALTHLRGRGFFSGRDTTAMGHLYGKRLEQIHYSTGGESIRALLEGETLPGLRALWNEVPDSIF